MTAVSRPAVAEAVRIIIIATSSKSRTYAVKRRRVATRQQGDLPPAKRR